MSYTYLNDNIIEVKNKIMQTCKKIGKYESEITLIGVTKTYEADVINASLTMGIENIGENRVQEIMRKYDDIKGPVRWHLIGHLQTNKVKYIIEKVDLIHSVDSIGLAEEINKRAEKSGKVMDVLLQVNIAEEESKFGTSLEELYELIGMVQHMKNLRVKGLMNIAPFTDDPEEVRPYFRKMKEIFDELSKMPYDNIEMSYLSMGMSNDYWIAIEEGANMIRVGSSIYGARDYTKKIVKCTFEKGSGGL